MSLASYQISGCLTNDHNNYKTFNDEMGKTLMGKTLTDV